MRGHVGCRRSDRSRFWQGQSEAESIRVSCKRFFRLEERDGFVTEQCYQGGSSLRVGVAASDSHVRLVVREDCILAVLDRVFDSGGTVALWREEGRSEYNRILVRGVCAFCCRFAIGRVSRTGSIEKLLLNLRSSARIV